MISKKLKCLSLSQVFVYVKLDNFNIIKIHIPVKKRTIKIDKTENIQESSLKHFHSSLGKIHTNKNRFLTEIHNHYGVDIGLITSDNFLMLSFGYYNVCCNSKSPKTIFYFLAMN